MLPGDPDTSLDTRDPCSQHLMDPLDATVYQLESSRLTSICFAGDAHCPRQYGVYPSSIPGECDTYYTCTNGKSAPTKCAEGLHYSDESGICVWARDSGRWQNRLLFTTFLSIQDRSPLCALLPGMTVTQQQHQSQSGRRKKGAPRCRRRSLTESRLRNWQMGSSVQEAR